MKRSRPLCGGCRPADLSPSTATRPRPRRVSPVRRDRDLPDHARRRRWASSPTRGRRPAGRTSGAPCPTVVEMQSEGGAAGAVHGALQAGALATTFTASQGLLLMIPNMFKIAGELTPAVFHVAARAIAGHARAVDLRRPQRRDGGARTGFAMLLPRLGAGGAGPRARRARRHARVAGPVPALLRRVPHVARGRRRSSRSTTTTSARWSTTDCVERIAARALTPDHPVLRGSAQNPDVFFQAREAGNPFLRRRSRRIVQRGDGSVRRADGPRATACSITSARRTPSASSC